MLNRADLRKADFTGAMLNGASLLGSKLQGAQFGCAERGTNTETDDGEAGGQQWPVDGCTWLQDADLSLAQLQDAFFSRTRLQGAQFSKAKLQGAWLVGAQLQGANLGLADLQGASLRAVQMQGAWLGRAQLQGAWLEAAQLQGASLEEAQLQGASLDEAQLQGAELRGAQLQGASLAGAGLQGVWLYGTQLQGASIANAEVWRARGSPAIDLADVQGVQPGTKPWGQSDATFYAWRDGILKTIPIGWHRVAAGERLSALDPDSENELKDPINAEFWKRPSSVSVHSKGRTIAFLTDTLRRARAAAKRSHRSDRIGSRRCCRKTAKR